MEKLKLVCATLMALLLVSCASAPKNIDLAGKEAERTPYDKKIKHQWQSANAFMEMVQDMSRSNYTREKNDKWENLGELVDSGFRNDCDAYSNFLYQLLLLSTKFPENSIRVAIFWNLDNEWWLMWSYVKIGDEIKKFKHLELADLKGKRLNLRAHTCVLWFDKDKDPWVLDPTGTITSRMKRLSDI